MTKKPQFLFRQTQTFTLLRVLGLFVLAPSALADDALALATKNQCMACH